MTTTLKVWTMTDYATDGPALRSTALITYANYLLADGNSSVVTDDIWPVAKIDLDYVAQNWNQTGYVLTLKSHASAHLTIT